MKRPVLRPKFRVTKVLLSYFQHAEKTESDRAQVEWEEFVPEGNLFGPAPKWPTSHSKLIWLPHNPVSGEFATSGHFRE
jgi:hypothetical protein